MNVWTELEQRRIEGFMRGEYWRLARLRASMMRPRLGWERWEDAYAEGGIRKGVRCRSTHPDWPSTRCVREHGHTGPHRFTSSADGRSVSWES